MKFNPLDLSQPQILLDTGLFQVKKQRRLFRLFFFGYGPFRNTLVYRCLGDVRFLTQNMCSLHCRVHWSVPGPGENQCSRVYLEPAEVSLESPQLLLLPVGNTPVAPHCAKAFFFHTWSVVQYCSGVQNSSILV